MVRCYQCVPLLHIVSRFAAPLEWSAATVAVTLFAMIFTNCQYFHRLSSILLAVSKSRCTGAKRAAGSPSVRPAAAQIDQCHVATPVKSSQFNAAAVTSNLETHFQQTYRRYRAGLAPDHLMAEHRPAAPHAASSAALCS